LINAGSSRRRHWLNLGNALNQTGSLDKAQSECDQAVDLYKAIIRSDGQATDQNNLSKALYLRAIVRHGLHSDAAAVEDLSAARAYALDPSLRETIQETIGKAQATSQAVPPVGK
jgi:tetratricopeptide (TPR) repeat protein